MARHPEDVARYEELLEATRDADGVCRRDEAVKLLTEELAVKADRIAEYATARAFQVADGFDRLHQPEVDDGQMALDIDTYLVVGDNERVPVDRATATHTRLWIDIQNKAKAKHDLAHGVKTMHAYRLLDVQSEHGCSMWEAQQILATPKAAS